ncbi:POFUT [Acanthosepion pharaonis]|uniref:GDP-fucose protein O-fucosyltransferase 1 n=1 Tax=Acanthosepion pharaonis TaxID=158019 RepID=A0A812EG11_ACAPH|nr:POFUT [Sepia pharaonis]
MAMFNRIVYNIFFFLLIVTLSAADKKLVKSFIWDERGYLIYCPCMGRFGNQAEHFLGTFGFAKAINRTLILPPWRTYKNIPFDDWFQVEPLSTYHAVILAEDFMAYLAPTYWPPGNRTGWCYLPPNNSGDCRMKEGNPFGQFWDGLNVDFNANEIVSISYMQTSKWKAMYPPNKYPVIAMRGAPASFPVEQKYALLHKYLLWSESIERQADQYIEDNFEGKEFVGIHLRNGVDWINACAYLDKQNVATYMASPQCLGYEKNTFVTKKMCLPSVEEILRLTKNIVVQTRVKIVFVATDKDPMLEKLQRHLKAQKVQVFHYDPWLPQLDLAILEKSKHFIGNCVSSFSSFVTRSRIRIGKPSSFWGYSSEEKKERLNSDL